METSMKYVLPTAMALAVAALAGCERPASTSSTTVVKEPTTVVQSEPVVKEKETIVQRDVPAAPPASSSSTTIVNPPAPPSSSTNVTIDAQRPEASTERERTTSSKRVETPLGTISRETTETSRTTRQ
jgi:hypothetical protein